MALRNRFHKADMAKADELASLMSTPTTAAASVSKDSKTQPKLSSAAKQPENKNANPVDSKQRASSLAIYTAIADQKFAEAKQLMQDNTTANAPIPGWFDVRNDVSKLLSAETDFLHNPTPLRAAVELTSGKKRNDLVRALLQSGADPTMTTEREIQSLQAPIAPVISVQTPAQALAGKDLIFATENSTLAAKLFLAEAEKGILDGKDDAHIETILKQATTADNDVVKRYFSDLPGAADANQTFTGVQSTLNANQTARLRNHLETFMHPVKIKFSV